jgi:hypothetical protein
LSKKQRPSTPRIFRSSGQPGFSQDAHPSRVFAHKIPRECQVEFATAPCTVHSPEGTVRAAAGDAIVTGASGERWPVARARFFTRYRPIAPTVEGQAGRYVSLRKRVIAVALQEPFEVLLADGTSRLHGHPGDWLVDYGDGSLGVVSAKIFAATYQIDD